MKMRFIEPAVAAAVLLLLAGCSGLDSKDDGEGAEGAVVEEAGGAGVYGAGEGDGAVTSGAYGQGSWAGASLDDPGSPLATRTIYFAFNSSDIDPEYVAVLRAHAGYLAANPNVRVTLEGHADERGTREYNLALGEHRARRVKQFMLAEGVGNAQINVISYGEERPVDDGSGESAWSRNRRVELVY